MDGGSARGSAPASPRRTVGVASARGGRGPSYFFANLPFWALTFALARYPAGYHRLKLVSVV